MSLTDQFNSYLGKNPHVYTMFVQFTNQAILAGRTKLSAWLIINRIRWESDVVIKSNEKFKISNKYAAMLSRKFMTDYPQHVGLFNTKEMKHA